MHWYYAPLIGAVALVAWASFRTPRALLWLAALIGSFVVSVGYLRGYESIEAANMLGVYTADATDFVPLGRDWLPPSIIAAACDAVVCALIYVYGRERWETVYLYVICLGMMAVNLVYASGVIFGFPPIPDRDTLGIILEALNYSALLLIGGTGVLNRVSDGDGGIRGAVGRVLRAGLANLRAPAKRSLWQK